MNIVELLIAGFFMCLFLGIPVFLIYKVYKVYKKRTRGYSQKRHPKIIDQNYEQNHANIINDSSHPGQLFVKV